MSSLPAEGEVLTGIFGIGHSAALMPDEKPLADDDILVRTLRVISSSSWPIRGSVFPVDDRGFEISQDMYFSSSEGVNGIYLNDNRNMICFPYELTSENNPISKQMESDEILKSISIGNDVFLVDNHELRRCPHPSEDLDRIETSQAASMGVRVLSFGGNASLSAENSYFCKRCKSVLNTEEDSGLF